MENVLENQKQTNESKPKAQDLRGLLQEEFLRRLKLNPQYSLRAYAQFLEMNSGTLSQILKGQRKMGPKTFSKLVKRLGLSPEVIESISSESFAQSFSQIHLDTFNVISDWYHFALLELIKLDDFNEDPKWMAKKLGITTSEVHMALERLLRLKYIEKCEVKGLKVLENNISTLSHEYTTVALKKLQSQILSKAIEALDVTPLEERLQTSLSVAIHLDDLPKVKEMIHRFRREVNAYVESHESKQEVYHMSVSLYPVTRSLKGEKSE